MNIVNKKVADLIPYERNTKKHDKTQIANVAESISQYGFVQPVVIDKDNVIVIGHCRVLGAKKLGMKEVPCVLVDELTPEQVNALRIVDNKTNESEWDMDFLAEELLDVDLSMFDFDFGFEEDEEDQEEDENPYTDSTDAPIYEMKGEQPKVAELFDIEKASQILSKVEDADIPEDIREFLRYASYRHVKFNYQKIAEFYAQASKEVQELFEESALVIIDFDAAIKNGFTKLSKRIQEMRNETD